MMTSELASPADEGTVREHKYGIYDAHAAWTNDEGAVVVCVTGEIGKAENKNFSLVLDTTPNGLARQRVTRDRTDAEALSRFQMVLAEIGEPCEYSPHGRSIRLIDLEIAEPGYYEHTPVERSQLAHHLRLQEKPSDLAVISLKRGDYCSEVIVWDPVSDSTDHEFVRVSTPSIQEAVKGNRGWYLAMPFTVAFDVVTFPLQVVTMSYMFAHIYGKAHMPHC